MMVDPNIMREGLRRRSQQTDTLDKAAERGDKGFRPSGKLDRGEDADAPTSLEKTADDLYAYVSASYKQLRYGMALLAIALPIILIVGGGVSDIENSLSAYYHANDGKMRDYFVGILFAVGAFLFFYKGYCEGENVALSIAGAAAILVALLPMCWPEGSPCCTTGVAHYVVACAFFILIAYVSIFHHDESLQSMNDERRKHFLKWVYRGLGAAMVILPALAFLADYLKGSASDSNIVLIVEIIGILVFSAYWIVKTIEITLIERQGNNA